MTEERPAPEPASAPPPGRRSVPTGALGFLLVVLLGVAVGVGIWLVLREDGEEQEGGATALSLEQLTELAAGASRPIYWAGAEPQTTYELTQTEEGAVFVRYLPAGAEVGDPDARYLTVGTYPQEDALAKLRASATEQGVEPTPVAGGGLALADDSTPTSVYLAFPGSDFQVEVFDPTEGRALELVRSGRITRVGAAEAAPAQPTRATQADLEELADELGHPVYWTGPDEDATYELTRTPQGRVYVRYLSEGAEVGSPRPDFLTVGTYPQEDALARLRETASANDAETIELEGGGLAMVDPSRPTSVYAAFPGEDLQLEVYDPSPERARELVSSGRLQPIGG